MKETKKIIVFFLAAICVAAADDPLTYTFESHFGKGIVAEEDVEVYKEEQYMIIRVTPIKGKLIPTVSLHDFAMEYTAIKDDERERCTVVKTTHTLEEVINKFEQSIKRKGFFDVTEAFSCTNKEFVPNSELDRFGEKIANFCNDYEVIFTDKSFIRRDKRSVKMMTGYALSCGGCWFSRC